MMRPTRPYLFSAAIGLLLSYSVPVSSMPVSAGAERGRLLYENHCTSCHISTLHVRDKRKSKTPAEVHAWILRWSVEQKLDWSEDELADVYQYLNSRYYKFPVEMPAK
jgi:mono/diheme cytochrome c family protein